MNATKWAASRTSRTMLDALKGKLSERKLRLIGVACARRVVDSYKFTECADALDLVEQTVDGTATAKERKQLVRSVAEVRRLCNAPQRTVPKRYHGYPAKFITGAVWDISCEPVGEPSERLARIHDSISEALESLCALWRVPSKERLRQAHILREIVGNPFPPVAFDAWRSSTAVAVAKQMYDSRDFGAMPILADALQDAGCDNDEVLNHCRNKPAVEHFRGCWVVDGVLGKS
jgi:hypothetical protein